MKIISKYKDYYDFSVGHDSDNLLIYNRNTSKLVSEEEAKNNKLTTPEYTIVSKEVIYRVPFDNYLNSMKAYSSAYIPPEFGHWLVLCFCDTIYHIFRSSKGEYIYTLQDFIDKVDPKQELNFTKKQLSKLSFYKYYFEPKSTNFNNMVNCPVVVYHQIYDSGKQGIYLNLPLRDIGFNKFLNPTACYQIIYNWISEHKPQAEIPSSPDDMDRFESKGFSKKSSFKHR